MHSCLNIKDSKFFKISQMKEMNDNSHSKVQHRKSKFLKQISGNHFLTLATCSDTLLKQHRFVQLAGTVEAGQQICMFPRPPSR